MKFVTFNIRCQPYLDGINAFIHRAGMIYDKIQKETPDVVCFQEVVPFQLEFLQKSLPEYDIRGSFNGKKDEQEGLFIAVRKKTLEITGLETIWLSPTPQIEGSRFEDASPYPRICVSTRLKEKETDKSFRVYNTHLDHRSEQARNKGLSMILGLISEHWEKAQIPYLFTGDFNAQKDSETIELCKDMVEFTANITDTFHGFGTKHNYGKIDYIFASSGVKCLEVAKWEDCHDGIYLSDHYPICAKIELE